jgi:hypothetical protein
MMRGRLFTLTLAGLIAISAGLAQIGPASASLEVTRSTAPRIKVGTRLNDNAIFDVPEGREIELLKTPQNSTHSISGPYRGTLSGYTPPCPWWKAVIGSCKEGGDIREGGTRGMRAPDPQ